MHVCVYVAGWPSTVQAVSVWMRRVPGFVGGAGAAWASLPLPYNLYSCPSTKALGSESSGRNKCLSPSWRKVNRLSSVWAPAALRWSIVWSLSVHLAVSSISSSASVTFSVIFSPLQGECKTNTAASGPPVLKEELFVFAARIRINLAIKHLHQCLMTPSHPRLLKTTQAPHLHGVAQSLLEVSANVMMSESERAFIYRCLQDCLKCTGNNYTDTVTAVANKC